MFKALARFFGFKPKAKPEAYAPPPPPSKFPPASQPFTESGSRWSGESRDPHAQRARKFERGNPPAAQSRPLPQPEPEPEPEPSRPAAEEIRAAAEQHVPIDVTQSPEAICGITPTMTRAQISDALARLYQRHNRASSSFDTQLAAEAEYMLDLIAGLREKYLSRPPGE